MTTSDGRNLIFSLLAESLQVGDIIIFDGDVFHRGCQYDGTCVALHIYLDVREVTRFAPNEDGSFNKEIPCSETA